MGGSRIQEGGFDIGYDRAYPVIQSIDGGYLVVGMSESFESGMYIAKISESGDVLWTKTVGESGKDRAYSIIPSGDGGYLIVGSFYKGGINDIYDMYIVKIDYDGNVLLSKGVGGDSDEEAFSAIRSRDGGYVVIGKTTSFGAGGEDIYIVKLDSDGNVLWTSSVGGSSEDIASSVVHSDDGGYIVVGFSESFNVEGMYIVKIDDDGNILWTKVVNGVFPHSVIRSDDGGYVIVGYTFGGGKGDMFIAKVEPSFEIYESVVINDYTIDSGGDSYIPQYSVSEPASEVYSAFPEVSSPFKQ